MSGHLIYRCLLCRDHIKVPCDDPHSVMMKILEFGREETKREGLTRTHVCNDKLMGVCELIGRQIEMESEI